MNGDFFSEALRTLTGTYCSLLSNDNQKLNGTIVDVKKDHLVFLLNNSTILYVNKNQILGISKNTKEITVHPIISPFYDRQNLFEILNEFKYSWVSVQYLYKSGYEGVLSEVGTNYIILISGEDQLILETQTLLYVHKGKLELSQSNNNNNNDDDNDDDNGNDSNDNDTNQNNTSSNMDTTPKQLTIGADQDQEQELRKEDDNLIDDIKEPMNLVVANEDGTIEDEEDKEDITINDENSEEADSVPDSGLDESTNPNELDSPENKEGMNEQTFDSITEQVSDSFSNQSSNGTSDQSLDSFTDQTTDDILNQVSDNFSNQSSDSFTDQDTESFTDQDTESFTDQATNPPPNQFQDFSTSIPLDPLTNRSLDFQKNTFIHPTSSFNEFSFGYTKPSDRLNHSNGLNIETEVLYDDSNSDYSLLDSQQQKSKNKNMVKRLDCYSPVVSKKRQPNEKTPLVTSRVIYTLNNLNTLKFWINDIYTTKG